MNDAELAAQIRKRHTINFFIQGAACYEGLDATAEAADRLRDIHPALPKHCRKVGIFLSALAWSYSESCLHCFHRAYWRRSRHHSHPYHDHHFLRRYAVTLGKQARRHFNRVARKQRAPRGEMRGVPLLIRAAWRELRPGHRVHASALAATAERSVHLRWGVPLDRLRFKLQPTLFCPVPGINAKSRAGRYMDQAVAAWSKVHRDGEGRLVVLAESGLWAGLIHEGFKGVAELACLHSLSKLDDNTYAAVIDTADRIELEIHGMRAGPALYARLLAAVEPPHRPPAALMHLARMDPDELDEFCGALMEDPPRARRLIMDPLDADAISAETCGDFGDLE
ncbi:MAG: hypothetical protein AAGE65_14360 [Planctomycetota bacterium]